MKSWAALETGRTGPAERLAAANGKMVHDWHRNLVSPSLGYVSGAMDESRLTLSRHHSSC